MQTFLRCGGLKRLAHEYHGTLRPRFNVKILTGAIE